MHRFVSTCRRFAYFSDRRRYIFPFGVRFVRHLAGNQKLSFIYCEYGVWQGTLGNDNAGEDFFLDLLFYHLKLRAYVVIELKTTEFKPEYAGKMNFYLSVVDDLLRHSQGEPSIGLILCKGKGKVMAEYALRDMGKPIGVSGFKLAELLPESLKGSLPTIEDLETELRGGEPS